MNKSYNMKPNIYKKRKEFVNDFSVSGNTLLHHIARYAVQHNKQQQFFKMLEDQMRGGTNTFLTNQQIQTFTRLLYHNL